MIRLRLAGIFIPGADDFGPEARNESVGQASERMPARANPQRTIFKKISIRKLFLIRTMPANQPQPPNPASQVHLFRILDAAANRASEGLRVVEDFVRFALDDRHLTELCKQLGHDFSAVLANIPSIDRLTSRETLADVGTDISADSEMSRSDVAEVLAANFKRVEQSLRSLEEYTKILNPQWAADLKSLRYRTYTLERAVDITRESRRRLSATQLYVMVDGRQTSEEFLFLVESLISAGVHVLQLRDKRLDDRQLLERARVLTELARNSPTMTIINDRPDLALLARADGVHVGQEELSIKDARSIVGPAALVGVSTHSIQQAQQAVLAGANYLGVGPTFENSSKPFDEYPGVELLREVNHQISLPAFAIGGVNLQNLSQVLATGFTRIAVCSAVTQAGDPAAAASKLLEGLKN